MEMRRHPYVDQAILILKIQQNFLNHTSAQHSLRLECNVLVIGGSVT